jgi:hypothetical protein
MRAQHRTPVLPSEPVSDRSEPPLVGSHDGGIKEFLNQRVLFDRALWETSGGERVTSKVGAAHSRLHSGSHRRRLSRLSALAGTAIFVPVLLLVTGLHQAPAQAGTEPVRPIKVVRVTKVVKVVEHAPVQRPAQ